MYQQQYPKSRKFEWVLGSELSKDEREAVEAIYGAVGNRMITKIGIEVKR